MQRGPQRITNGRRRKSGRPRKNWNAQVSIDENIVMKIDNRSMANVDSKTPINKTHI